ncbi:DUF4271 domain-containing protein [Olivibacter sp. XZL3]|uniref:DUF4271 domain-containing protein n=1 Tax=Olivibacter sp. XZL3 TaxID=1735116 RepID=UPI0010649022|nr:DUF4271 domain-containing protein [Olivibacter sp. XZL3]
MLKIRLVFLLLVGYILFTAHTVQDTTFRKPATPSLKYLVQDSARFARALEKQRVKDSLERRADSLALLRDSIRMMYIKPLPMDSKNQFLDSLKKVYIIDDGNTLLWGKHVAYTGSKQLGARKVYRPRWILYAVFALFLFFALIRLSFMKDLEAIATSFYNNRVLLQISKEDNLITSWPFVFLYLLFGFTIGLFLYLYSVYGQLQFSHSPMSVFFTIAALVLVLSVVKILITRAIGFVFGIQKLVRDYISILYLSYFNAAIIFLPLLLVLSLAPTEYIRVWLIVSCLVGLLVFAMQLLRASNTVLKSYQFSKFYLFIYLCTLEVGPILILIKLLGI